MFSDLSALTSATLGEVGFNLWQPQTLSLHPCSSAAPRENFSLSADTARSPGFCLSQTQSWEQEREQTGEEVLGDENSSGAKRGGGWASHTPLPGRMGGRGPSPHGNLSNLNWNVEDSTEWTKHRCSQLPLIFLFYPIFFMCSYIRKLKVALIWVVNAVLVLMNHFYHALNGFEEPRRLHLPILIIGLRLCWIYVTREDLRKHIILRVHDWVLITWFYFFLKHLGRWTQEPCVSFLIKDHLSSSRDGN